MWRGQTRECTEPLLRCLDMQEAGRERSEKSVKKVNESRWGGGYEETRKEKMVKCVMGRKEGRKEGEGKRKDRRKGGNVGVQEKLHVINLS